MTGQNVRARGGVTFATLAVAALAATTLVGCSGGGDDTTPPGPTVPSGPGHYVIAAGLCERVSVDPLIAILPVADQEDLIEDDSLIDGAETDTGRIEPTVQCLATLGLSEDDARRGSFTLTVAVLADATAASQLFDQYHETNLGNADAADLSGLGEKAYRFTVALQQAGAPSVRVLDGNAVFTADWSPNARLGGPSTGDEEPLLPDGIYEALAETVRGALTTLRS